MLFRSLKQALDSLKDAVNGNWDFRETYYAFCVVASVQAHPQALVDQYMARKQAPGEKPNSFLMAMEIASQPIEYELGGEQKALEIAVKNLAEEQLRSHLTKALKEGKVDSFQQCVTYTASLEIKYGLYRLNATTKQKTTNPKPPQQSQESKPSESKQDNQGRRGGGKGGWRGRGRGRGRSQAQARSDPTPPQDMHVQAITELPTEGLQKAEYLFEMAKQFRWNKNIAAFCDEASEVLKNLPQSQESTKLKDKIKAWMVHKKIHGRLNNNPSLLKGRDQEGGRKGGRGGQRKRQDSDPPKSTQSEGDQTD